MTTAYTVMSVISLPSASFLSALGSILTGFGVIVALLLYFVETRRDRRERESYTIERRRLAEVNLNVKHDLLMTPVHPDVQNTPRAFSAFQLTLLNQGSGPVDILGALVSSRTLTSTERGVGLRGRDIGWSDFEASYWNSRYSDTPFVGISSTKHIVTSIEQFPRMSVGESMGLMRIDAVNSPDKLKEMGNITMMYQVFTVARGYSLGEILRQLGGKPPDPIRSVSRQLLQFQTLAEPNYFRLLQIHQAMFNINRFAFRLACGDPDPLGMLTTPDAWRLFLLHHWEFIDEADVAPATLPPKYRAAPLKVTSRQINAEMRTQQWYPHLILPDDWNSDPREKAKYERAQAYCKEQLAPLVIRWENLKKKIQQAQSTTSLSVPYNARIPNKAEVPHEWYPNLIHNDSEYQQRWLALMQEGYLISAPLYKKGLFGRTRKKYTKSDIPADPRILEPFTVRTRYYLVNVSLGNDPRPLVEEVEDQDTRVFAIPQ